MQGARDVTAMIYPPIVSALIDEKNRQIVKNLAILLFKTQVKALSRAVNIFTFINVMLALLMQHIESLKGLVVEVNMIKVAFL